MHLAQLPRNAKNCVSLSITEAHADYGQGLHALQRPRWTREEAFRLPAESLYASAHASGDNGTRFADERRLVRRSWADATEDWPLIGYPSGKLGRSPTWAGCAKNALAFTIRRVETQHSYNTYEDNQAGLHKLLSNQCNIAVTTTLVGDFTPERLPSCS